MSQAFKASCAAALAAILLLGWAPVGASGPTIVTADELPAAAGAKPSARPAEPNYTIRAMRYAMVPKFPLDGLVMGAPKDQLVEIAMVFWVIEGAGTPFCSTADFIARNGFHNFRSRTIWRRTNWWSRRGFRLLR